MKCFIATIRAVTFVEAGKVMRYCPALRCVNYTPVDECKDVLIYSSTTVESSMGFFMNTQNWQYWPERNYCVKTKKESATKCYFQ